MTARRVDADVALEIEGRLIRGNTPAQVQRALTREVAFSDRLPTLRTIQRMAQDLAPDRRSGPWALTPDEPDPVTMMRVLGASLADGWRVPLTEAEAGWIRVVHRAVSDIGPLTLRSIARLYLAYETDHGWLDRALAIAPWRGAAQRAAYDALDDHPRLSIALTAAQAAR